MQILMLPHNDREYMDYVEHDIMDKRRNQKRSLTITLDKPIIFWKEVIR